LISTVVTPSAISASSRGSAAATTRRCWPPRRFHGRDDAAAGARDLLIARAGQPLFEFAGAVAAIDQMGMAIDQARRDPAAPSGTAP
jgi:hypothetical protein